MKSYRKGSKGFTLIEILIVIAIIAILAGAVIVALNPGRLFDQANDTTRRTDLTELLSAISRNRVDNRGIINAAITTTRQEICKTGGSCSGLADLSFLTTNATYIDAMPIDPECTSTNGTCYFIQRNANNTITVDAFQYGALASISFTQ